MHKSYYACEFSRIRILFNYYHVSICSINFQHKWFYSVFFFFKLDREVCVLYQGFRSRGCFNLPTLESRLIIIEFRKKSYWSCWGVSYICSYDFWGTSALKIGCTGASIQRYPGESLLIRLSVYKHERILAV